MKEDISYYLKPALLLKYIALTIIVLICLWEALEMDWRGLLMAMQVLVFSLVPTLLKKYYGIRTPHALQAGGAIFLFATIFLGEEANFYERFWWWDLLFHTLAGLAFGLIGYMILVLTYRKQAVRLAPLFTAIFAVSFSLTISVLWEILEFAVDQLLNTNMQPSATDTMLDLIVGLIGALVSALSGYRYVQYNDKNGMNGIIEEGVRKNA
jgi:hypothetical protein